MSNKPVLTEYDEQCFADFIRQAYGINIHEHQLEKFRDSISAICLAVGNLDAQRLLQKMIAEPFCVERIQLIEKITIDESYFFRDSAQIDFLKYEYLPKLIEKKRQAGDKQLRIWSAGCSTGQEIYSIAILLYELLIDYDDWNLHLLGTDINHQSLNRAKQAEYNAWNIRTEQGFINNSGYFQEVANDCFRLSDEIKAKVNISYLNLAKNSFPSIMSGTCALDMILCRNVFIYFDEATIQQASRRFYDSLNESGILMLSATDPLSIDEDYFVQEKRESVFFLRKKPLFFASITQSAVEPKIRLAQQSNKQVSELNLAEAKQLIIKHLSVAEWQAGLNQVNKALESDAYDAELLQFKAKCLINLGQMLAAQEACEQSIIQDEVEPHSYLLYGLILMQRGYLSEAETAFRQTIFLNNAFMEAHYQLGQILLKKGQKKLAIKSIQNALALAALEKPDRPIHNVIPLTYSSFSGIMKNELELIQHEDSDDRR